MKTTIASILLILVQALDLSALSLIPLPPQTLRKLVLESDCIIVGYVCKTSFTWKTSYERDEIQLTSVSIAKIAVLKCLQGYIKEDTIEIAFDQNTMFPAPAKYDPKSYVITFINRKDNRYSTDKVSYESKTLARDEVEIYSKRIREIQDILTGKDKVQQCRETIKWLVKCAEIKATMPELPFELLVVNSRMPHCLVSDRESHHLCALTASQKARLLKALLSTPGYSRTEYGLIELVYKGNEQLVDRWMLKALKSIEEQDCWRAIYLMNKLRWRKSSSRFRSIFEDYVRLLSEEGSSNHMNQLIDRVRLVKYRNRRMRNLIDRFIVLYVETRVDAAK